MHADIGTFLQAFSKFCLPSAHVRDLAAHFFDRTQTEMPGAHIWFSVELEMPSDDTPDIRSVGADTVDG
jgi:hypothetical protein